MGSVLKPPKPPRVPRITPPAVPHGGLAENAAKARAQLRRARIAGDPASRPTARSLLAEIVEAPGGKLAGPRAEAGRRGQRVARLGAAGEGAPEGGEDLVEAAAGRGEAGG